MSKIFLYLFASMVTLAACTGSNDTANSATQPLPDADTIPEAVNPPLYNGYTLAWADEFNDTTLDLRSWSVEVNGDGGGNSELQHYRADNVALGREPESRRRCLIITAKKENFEEKPATSGRINSMGKRFFGHGRIEAAIKLPKTANGLWPAFWLMGNDYPQVGWPSCGEIDILEMGHANGVRDATQDRYFNGACHWGTSWNGGAYPNYAKASTWSYSLQDTFHLFTLLWDERYIKMYLDLDRYPDGEPYYEMSISDKSSDDAPGSYFSKEFFILFNLAVGGNFPQIWDIDRITALSGGEAKMYVDFVRVYQIDN
jgi:beta-glucanase (GH16 family)